MQTMNRLLQSDELVQLVKGSAFVGWAYGIDYDTALVMTNDAWKAGALGVPNNAFLVAAGFDPDKYASTMEADREVLLLRVVSAARLPHDDDLVRTKIDYCRQQTQIHGDPGTAKDYDAITRNELQFGGLQCRVLGTFYMKDGDLWLGSDLESYATASRLNVYRPRGEALRLVVNHVDPVRRRTAADEAKRLGIQKPLAGFRIGTVRYTSTDRLHRRDGNELVPVSIQPSDFLARRTAVLGMTRTGKSNMIKQTVAVVKRVADEGGIPIGQIIYDLNGEYANANQQDQGALADVYPADTVRYRMLSTPDFAELQNNFYLQINEGFSIVRRAVAENRGDNAGDVQVFLNASFDEPDQQDRSAHNRWQVRVAAYKSLLHRAQFTAPAGHAVTFPANQAIRNAVNQSAGQTLPDPSRGLTLDQAIEWFLAAREANRATQLRSSSGKVWFDEEALAMVNMLANKNANDAYIRGYKVLTGAQKYHSPRRSSEVGEEIYEHLRAGRIVIVDLSVGDPTMRENISKQIAADIFHRSMGTFIEGETPPNIVIYIEEAHNVIGKDAELTEIWPRIAKEGAKYRISLVYATQEVSAMHPNILANTENWFITHLNNEREIRELARFYDFADFSRSLIQAQDVGFARVKTLSGPFVIPVQIDKFDAEAETRRVRAHAAQQAGGTASPVGEDAPAQGHWAGAAQDGAQMALLGGAAVTANMPTPSTSGDGAGRDGQG
jgi:hypothetical protein